MSTSLATLKQQLAEVLRPAAPERAGLATGIDALDAALPARGVPRGRLTELLGARGSGRTTLLRTLVEHTVAQRTWVAYIDARRTLAPRDWAHLGTASHGVTMVRPRTPAAGAWCADVLLRSGAFGLVILDGAPPLTRQVAVRLTRLARDADAALVVAAEDEHGATSVGGALRLRVERTPATHASPRQEHRRRAITRTNSSVCEAGPRSSSAGRGTLVITVEKGGVRRTVEVSYVVRVARRLCAHPEVPDRRGVARSRARSAPTGERHRAIERHATKRHATKRHATEHHAAG
ncbi:MAG TPA: hypothetical protein VFJ96_05065 [Gemmatimonadaceae bacterium]|nr:hypothetical protein [Gemmatimonadaceae bacterium]